VVEVLVNGLPTVGGERPLQEFLEVVLCWAPHATGMLPSVPSMSSDEKTVAEATPADGADLRVEAQHLAALVAHARKVWPAVELDEAVFARHVAQRLPAGGDPALALAELHISDLYLACALAHGSAQALSEFERQFLSQVPVYIGHLRQPLAFVEEVKQRLREKLFVAPPEGAPKIGEYAGRGPLGGWTRLAAVRIALNLIRDDASAQATGGEPDDIFVAGSDPELELLKAQYRPAFRAALEAVLEGLPAEDRNLLRLYYIDGLTIDDLARLYRRHRSTMSRQINVARKNILTGVRQRVVHDFAVAPAELNSLMGLVQSQLDVSLFRFLSAKPS
jgi:RNA polymerase sigma-70 factor (ECF subfamily)